MLVEGDPIAPCYGKQGRPTKDGQWLSRGRSPAVRHKTQSQAPPDNRGHSRHHHGNKGSIQQPQNLPATLALQVLLLRKVEQFKEFQAFMAQNQSSPNNHLSFLSHICRLYTTQ